MQIDRNYQAKSPPSGSRFSGPWFEVDVTNLEFNSIFVDQPTYLFSFAQIRVSATSDLKPTSLKYTPTTKTFVSTAKAITGKSRALSVTGSFSMNVAQVTATWGASSGIESTQNQWAIIAERTMTSAEGKDSENIFWRYAHNDVAFKTDRLQKWTYERSLLPSATFTLNRSGPAPVVEAEVMVLWSEDSEEQHAKQRGFFPLRIAAGTDRDRQKSPVFANFIYQVAVKVDLNDVKDQFSDVTIGNVADTLTWNELHDAFVAKRGATHLEPIKKTAEKESDVDPEKSVVTDCHVLIHRAIEGRVSLSDEEKKGRGFPSLLRPPLLNSVIECFAGMPISIQISAPSSPGASASLATPLPSPSPSPPGTQGRDPSKKRGPLTRLSRLIL